MRLTIASHNRVPKVPFTNVAVKKDLHVCFQSAFSVENNSDLRIFLILYCSGSQLGGGRERKEEEGI